MAARKVLVVEGDWRIRKLIRINLEAHNLAVVEAADGKGCRQALGEQGFDLILLGAQLPDTNGWNMVRDLRSDGRRCGPPIIVLVAEPIHSRLLCRFQGVTPLLKPFSAHSLLQAVDSILGSAEGSATPS